ncbi:MAG: CAAX prenyl protease-like protein [Linnemannia gamsii]|nr:MAG: CAAX prenyl protease-like protein [Linnemannia gamsii]
MRAAAFDNFYLSLLSRQEGYAFPYRSAVLSYKYFFVLWKQYILHRHYQKLCTKSLPETLKGYVSEEQFHRAQAYGRDKARYSFTKAAFLLVLETLWFTHNVLPRFWDLSSGIMFGLFSLETENEELIELPSELYRIFVVEERHGFNKQSWGLFMKDFVVMTLVRAVFEMPLYAGLIKVFKMGGANFYIHAWLFVVAFQLLMIIVYPSLIQPLFNKFTPLPKGELPLMIEALARRVQFPLQKLFVVDGSKCFSHSNAYFYGFFKSKRIVLFDTLLEHLRIDETCAVLGHWSYNHTNALLVGSLSEIFFAFFLFSQMVNNRGLFTSFGFTNSAPTLVGFVLFLCQYTPISKVTDFARNTVSRDYEFLADAFACDLGYAASLSSGLMKLQLKNLGNTNPYWLYSMYHRNHPEIVERLDATKQRTAIPSKSNKID